MLLVIAMLIPISPVLRIVIPCYPSLHPSSEQSEKCSELGESRLTSSPPRSLAFAVIATTICLFMPGQICTAFKIEISKRMLH